MKYLATVAVLAIALICFCAHVQAGPDDDARAALALASVVDDPFENANALPPGPKHRARSSCPATCDCGCVEGEDCTCDSDALIEQARVTAREERWQHISNRPHGMKKKAKDGGYDWTWNARRMKWQRPSGQEGSTQTEAGDYNGYRLMGAPGPTYQRRTLFRGFRGNGAGCSGGG